MLGIRAARLAPSLIDILCRVMEGVGEVRLSPGGPVERPVVFDTINPRTRRPPVRRGSPFVPSPTVCRAPLATANIRLDHRRQVDRCCDERVVVATVVA